LKLPLILALDIGTSSVRAALYDGNAEVVPRTSTKIEYQFVTTADGGFEIDADVLLGHVVAAIDAVVKKASRLKGEIECVASCAFWHSLMGVDDKGKPTTPVLGWADTRSREHTSVLRERFDENEIHNRTGAHFHSSFWPSKLLWLQSKFPNIFIRTAMWVSFCDYLLSHLIDPSLVPYESHGGWITDDIHLLGYRPAYKADPLLMVTSNSMASATGMFNIHTCRWDEEMVGSIGLSLGNLPQVVRWKGHGFNLRRKYKVRWPRLKDVEIFPAIGDGAADHIGSCGIGKEKASLMVGTSAAMRIALRREPPAKIPDGLWCYRIDRERLIVGGALSDGGNLYQWVSDNFKVPKNAADEMRRRGAAAHGLTMMPFFHGERSTGYNENATGSITGLAPSHDATDILQAAMEAVAYRLAEIDDRLKTIAKFREIVASGGALRDSSVWAQIIADVLGRDLVISAAQESSLRGAVLLALESLGKIESIEKLAARQGNILTHHPDCHAVYKQAREQHEQAYRVLSKKHL
jgi:gluconokinase